MSGLNYLKRIYIESSQCINEYPLSDSNINYWISYFFHNSYQVKSVVHKCAYVICAYVAIGRVFNFNGDRDKNGK